MYDQIVSKNLTTRTDENQTKFSHEFQSKDDLRIQFSLIKRIDARGRAYIICNI